MFPQRQTISRPLVRILKELYSLSCTTDVKVFSRYIALFILRLPSIVHDLSLTSVDTGMASEKTCFHLYGKRITLDGTAFGLAREIYCRKVYFALPGFALKSLDTVIDLGANTGVFTTLAACICRRVIAVEAQSKFIPEIELNAKNNNCRNNISIEFGIVGAGSGIFSDPRSLMSASHFDKPPPLISMGDLINRHSIESVHFLKIDIEGSEFDLFSRDTSWLSRIEKIAMEVHLEFGEIYTIVHKLHGYGFDVWLVDNNQRLVDKIVGNTGYVFARNRKCVVV